MSSEAETTRERILSSCLQLLEKGDGRGVRMSDIAKHAGVSRQAVYLHFGNRAELLAQTTFYLDRIHNTDANLAPSRAAKTGIERLNAFLKAWTDYLPVVWPSLHALAILAEHDEDARKVLDHRMQDLWEGCDAAIAALERDGTLAKEYTRAEASDLLWAFIKSGIWHDLTSKKKWSQPQYGEVLLKSANRLFVKV